MKDWQKVYENSIAYRTEMVKDVLQNHDIISVIVPKQISQYQMGYFELYVKSEDVLNAIKIIQNEIRFE